MESAEDNDARLAATPDSTAGTVIERFPLPAPPPPIRANRFGQGPPPPPGPGTAVNQGWRSPQASANPVQLLGPAAVVRSTSRTTRNVVIGLVLVLFLGVLATAMILVQAFENTTLVSSLERGDCLQDFFEQTPNGEYVEVFLVDTAPCEQAHALEVYAVTDLLWGSDVYPGLDNAFATGEEWCFAQYDTFVGGDYATSLYEVWTFVPQEGSWQAGDRTVQCLVGRYDEMTLTLGTLEGVDR